MLRFNHDGFIHHWDCEYNPEVARVQLCRLISRENFPLSFGESTTFEEYIKIAHNPSFAIVSRQTTTSDFTKYFNERRGVLVESRDLHRTRSGGYS